eukprot:GHVS01103312.1.p1 GENE.GHVS01103312.1~~GHVS01103312.1.p1  ORF type:complete len:154 (-),score=6.35 GHVS01103312.1:75-536(-)
MSFNVVTDQSTLLPVNIAGFLLTYSLPEEHLYEHITQFLCQVSQVAFTFSDNYHLLDKLLPVTLFGTVTLSLVNLSYIFDKADSCRSPRRGTGCIVFLSTTFSCYRPTVQNTVIDIRLASSSSTKSSRSRVASSVLLSSNEASISGLYEQSHG